MYAGKSYINGMVFIDMWDHALAPQSEKLSTLWVVVFIQVLAVFAYFSKCLFENFLSMVLHSYRSIPGIRCLVPGSVCLQAEMH